jgi:hypothetical protein
MSTTQTDELLSVGEVATRLGVALHRVLYAIKANEIEPARRAAGRFRLFDGEAVEKIRAEVNRPPTQAHA